MLAEHWITERYRVVSELASGGSGIVYRVHDVREDVELALKCLRADKVDGRSVQLFRNEYRTLCQLAHPRIVSAYDYGVYAAGPYYTMELLDGIDVREAAPLPVSDVCRLLRDVASALAMLHTRRLLHRDVSYRNVRCTAAGAAKLIDFGAMMPIGAAAEVIGTAPFIPPEAVAGKPLEPRSDLYALGALAYWMLSARHAYPANNLQTLKRLWASAEPPNVSTRVEGVPAALDQLVMSLLSHDPSARPASAAEVMDRLAAIAELPPLEDLRVAAAYFVKPELVGRDRERHRIREYLRQGAGSTHQGPLLLEGAEGVGKTRMLEEVVIEARLAGWLPITPRRALSHESYALLRDLLEQVFSHVPDGAALVEADDRALLSDQFALFGAPKRATQVLSLGELRPRLQGALTRWFVRASGARRLCIAVDDFHRADDESTALLAALAADADARQLRLAFTFPLASAGDTPAVRLVRQLGAALHLHKLAPAELEQLLDSLFGDVPNKGRVAHWMYERTRGNPLECVELAHYLVACEAVIYSEGTWLLPASLPREVPRGLEQTRRARMAALPSDQRSVAEATAVFAAPISPERCARMVDTPERQVCRALDTLVRLELLREQHGDYAFGAEALRLEVEKGLDPERTRALHESAGQLLLQSETLDFHTELRAAHHLMRGHSHKQGADRIAALARDPNIPRDISELFTAPLALALTIYRELQASPAEIAPLLVRLTNATFLYDHGLVHYGAELLAQLWRDAGLDRLSELGTADAPDGNWMPALLARAAKRYEDSDPRQRGLPPSDALANLSSASVLVLAAAVLKYDIPRIVELWQMVEPIARLGSGTSLSAAPELVGIALRGLQVGETAVHEQRLAYIARMRDASHYPGFPAPRRLSVIATQLHHIAMAISALDGAAAMRMADEIDALGLEMYRGASEQVRFMVFMYRGELERAERCRARLDVFALQGGAGTQFELWLAAYMADPYALWDDALGLKRSVAHLKRLAASEPGYLPMQWIATGHHCRVRADYAHAIAAFECARELAPRDRHGSWLLAFSGFLDTLVESEQFARAHALGRELLDSLAYSERFTAFIEQRVACSMAVAEAHVGRVDQALARVQQVLDRELVQGKSPLQLGRLHEALASIALVQGDAASFAQQLAQVRSCFSETNNPVLTKRHDRLAALGRRRFPDVPDVVREDDLYTHNALLSLTEQTSPAQRAARALALILHELDAEKGFLFFARGSRLELAASSDDRPAPTGLQGMLHAATTEMFEETECTITLSPDARAGSGATTVLCGQQEFVPFPLSITVEGARELVGVVAIPISDDSALQFRHSRLIDAVSASLYAASSALTASDPDEPS